MALRYIFVPQDDADFQHLHQGDVLQKTDALKDVISQAHPYYANAESYHFFMVLTQSCDLVRRGKKGAKARYITLAAMRPTSIDIGRVLSRYSHDDAALPITVCKKEKERDAREYLEKLLNNTEAERFFIRREAHEAFSCDYSVFLALSIALRVDHYDECLNAKIAQLTDVFQAKIGWLTSNIYGRVGTPDISDWVVDANDYKDKFYDEVLYARTAWLAPQQFSRYQNEVEGKIAISEDDQRQVLRGIPDDVEIAAEEIAEYLLNKRVLAGEDMERAKKKTANVLKNSPILRRLIR